MTSSGSCCTRAPSRSRAARNSVPCPAGRVSQIVLPVSAAGVGITGVLSERFENRGGTLAQQILGKDFTELLAHELVAADLGAQHARAIDGADESAQIQFIAIDQRQGGDRHLATT